MAGKGSYPFPNHPALSNRWVVPSVGVEPTRPCGHLSLSQARLPVSPRGEFDWYISIIYHVSVVRYISCARDDHCSIGAMCGITTSNNFCELIISVIIVQRVHPHAKRFIGVVWSMDVIERITPRWNNDRTG